MARSVLLYRIPRVDGFTTTGKMSSMATPTVPPNLNEAQLNGIACIHCGGA
jgi:hypothetical protein